jgi:phospholipase C
MPGSNQSNAIDHEVVLMFENRSVDNLLGCLYVPRTDPDVRQP